MEPTVIEPRFGVPRSPAIARPNAVFVVVLTPARLPPLSVSAAVQLAYCEPSAFIGGGSWSSGVLPSRRAASGMLRQGVVSYRIALSGSRVNRSHGVIPSPFGGAASCVA